MRDESACACGSLQRANVDAQFIRQLIEREQFVLSLMMCHGIGRSMYDIRRCRTTATVPGSIGLEWYREQCCEFGLFQAD